MDTTGRRDDRDEIEITPEMIGAGAAILCAVESLDLGRGYAERLTQRILEAALKKPHLENFASD